jgi:hypothetical protein
MAWFNFLKAVSPTIKKLRTCCYAQKKSELTPTVMKAKGDWGIKV